MPYFRALLSALTFFGGHVLNRRLDRVVVVFAALASVGVAGYFLLPSLLFHTLGSAQLAWVLRAPGILIIGTAILSAALTWMDARKAPVETPLPRAARLASEVLSGFGFLLLGVAIVSFLTMHVPDGPLSSSSRDPDFATQYLYTSTLLGGDIKSFNDLQPPPPGPNELRGRIVLDGKPVAHAELEVILNGAFEAESLATDEHGEFDIELPAGKWFINRVTLTRWADAPADRKLLLFSEHEPLRSSGRYARYHFNNGTGLEVSLPAAANAKVPTFELRDALDVQWPLRIPRGTTHPAVGLEANIATSSISWVPVPAATEYEVQLNSVEREGNSASYRSILRRRQAEATLRLADLPQRPRDSTDPDEYAVVIYAFDANGRLVTQSAENVDEFGFSLAGEVRLAREAFADSAPASSATAEYFKNLERLSLIDALLDRKQLDSARVILAEITDDAPPGRKAAMQGAIEALAGNCAVTLPLFDKADVEGGAGCARPKYRRLCETP